MNMEKSTSKGERWSDDGCVSEQKIAVRGECVSQWWSRDLGRLPRFWSTEQEQEQETTARAAQSSESGSPRPPIGGRCTVTKGL